MKKFPSRESGRLIARALKRLQIRRATLFVTLFAVLLSTFTFVSQSPARADTAGTGACTQTFTKTGTGEVAVTESAGYCYVALKNTGAVGTQTTFSWTRPSGINAADVLVIGGGGGAGARHGGGGGAGAFVEKTNFDIASASAVSIAVGAGGAGASGASGNTYIGTKGQNSSFKSGSNGLTALGGGAGQNGLSTTEVNGGSGGGAGHNQTAGSVTSQTQTTFAGATLSGITFGSQGAAGANEGDGANDFWAGGGGGGAVGSGALPTNNGSAVTSLTTASLSRGGNGGEGKATSILTTSIGTTLSVGQVSGSSVYFSGGGGGGIGEDGAAGGNGGLGGGANGTRIEATGNNGVATTGGGGGGSGFSDLGVSVNPEGGDGGSGLVLIKYALQTTAGDGSCVQNVSYSAGVSVTRSGNDCIVTFTSASNNWTAPAQITSIRALIVGGGGAGGCAIGGGGGAGEFIEYSSFSVTGGTLYPVSVGSGGQPQSCGAGLPGASSTFSSVTAHGGGGGGVNETIGPSRSLGTSTQANGSGGGGGYPSYLYTSATTTSANPRELFTVTKRTISGATVGAFDGGTGSRGVGPAATAGGGGGAGGAGVSGSSVSASNQFGGAGGIGVSSNISGTSTFYAGGGGGGINGNPGNTCECLSTGAPGAGGSSVGGAAGAKLATNAYPGSPNSIGNGSAGAANTGSGGGGGSNTAGGAGADGVVVIRYALATQSALSVTSTSAYLGTTLALTTSGGSGSGAVSFAVTSAGTAGCSVSGSTLSYTNTGTCTITATKAASGGFEATTSSATTVTISAYTVTYDSKGGSSIAGGTFSVGGSISEPTAPIRTGYAFGGWSATDGGTAITWPYSPSGSSNFTLYAKWTANQSIDYSLELSGTAGQYGQVSGGQILPASGAFTLETWFKPAADVSNNGNAVLISQGTNGGRFYLKRSSTGSMIYLREGTANEATCGTAPGEVWTHIAITYSSGTTTCFLNGVQQSTQIASTSLLSGFVVGDYAAGLNSRVNTWKGSIDEVRVYNTARTASQISEDAHAYATIGDSSLIAYYDFNEGAGTTGFNQKYAASSATNLTLGGSPTFTDVASTVTTSTAKTISFPRSYLNNLGGWTTPSGIASANALIVGGGGGGAGSFSTSPMYGGGGGGGGGAYLASSYPVSGVIPVVVGYGGLGGTLGTSSTGREGSRGGTSSFGSVSAGGGGGGGCSGSSAWYVACNAGTQQNAGSGTAGGGGGGSSNYLNAYNFGAAGTGSNVTVGGTTYTAQTGFRGGYFTDGGTSGTGNGGPGGGARAAANRNTIGSGFSSSITGTSVEYGRGGTAFGVTGYSYSALASGYGTGGSGSYSASGPATNGGNGASGVVIVSYSLPAQSALSVTSISAYLGSTLPLTTSGGSGSGAVTYSVTSAGTASCSVSGSTLSFTSAGTCTVTATKASADGYAEVSSSATTITVTNPLIAYESFNRSVSSTLTGNLGGSDSQGLTGSWLAVNSKNGFRNATGVTGSSSAVTQLRPNYPAGVGFAFGSPNIALGSGTGGASDILMQNARQLSSSVSMDTDRDYYMTFLSQDAYHDNQLMVGLLNGLPTSVDDTSKTAIHYGYVPDDGPNGQIGIDIGPANRSASCPQNAADTCGTADVYSAKSAISGGLLGQTTLNGLNYPHFILAKISASSSGNDTIRIKNFAYGTTVPENDSAISWDATHAAAVTGSFTHLSVQMNTLGYPNLDEVRLGYTYAAVVNPVITKVLTLNPNFTGSTVTTQTVSSGVDTIVAAPTRTGYTFAGWNTDQDGTSGANYTTSQAINVTADTTLFAKWTRASYTVTYNSKGGTAVTSGTYEFEGSIASAPTAPTKTGYTFSHWSATDGGNAITFPYSPGTSSNITLYAAWTGNQRNDYALNFTGNAGSNGTTTTTTIIPASTAFTIEAWVKAPTSTSNNWNATIFSQGTSTGTLYLERNEMGILNLMRPGASGEIRCGHVPANFWAHVAVTYDGSSITTCYLNGVSQNTTSGSTAIASNFMVGGRSSTASAQDSAWIGQIDEVRVYNVARSASEILNDGHVYGPTDTSSLVAYYDFNDGTGATATNKKDSAATNTNLTLNGSPTWTDLATTTTSAGVSRVTFERTYLNNYGGWDTPDGFSTFRTVIVGGGGGGGDSSSSYTGGGGGAGGYFSTDSLTASGKLTIKVGAGGAGGHTTAARGGTGGTTSIGTLKVGGGGGGNGYEFPTASAAGAGAGGSDFLSGGNGGGGRSRNFGDNAAKTGGAGGSIASGGVSFQSNTYTGTAGVAGNDAYAGDVQSGGPGGARIASSRTSSISGASVVYAKGGPYRAWEDGSNSERPFTYGSGGSTNYSYGVTEAASNLGGTGAPGVVVLSWQSGRTVTFKSNYVGGDADATQIVVPSTSTALTANAFTRAGYTFEGWTENSDGTGTSYTDEQNVSLSNDLTLHAKWTANTNTVTYDSKGGTAVTSGSFTTGGSIASAPAAPTRAGYTLAGWSATDGGTVVIFPYSPTATSGITLYAKWTANTNTVTYDSKGGTSVTSGSFTTGGSISAAPTAPTRAGYQLAGWSDTDGGTLVTFPYSPTATSAITLYAKWTANTNTVTYDSKGGTAVSSGSFTTGGSIASAPTAPTRTGYGFDGWSATDGGTVITFPYSPTATSAITLYAKWTGNTNAVTYDSKGGSAVTSGSFTTGGSIASAPAAPTRAGYTLAGWSATDGGTVVTFPYSPAETSAITLYAKWTANTNTVTYNSKGGSAVASGSFTTGGSISAAPTAPTRAGYTFDGWAETDGGTVVTFPYSPTAASAIILYAKWTVTSCSPTSSSITGYTVYVFTDLGTCTWTVPNSAPTGQAIVVAGGGGGGSGGDSVGGGGGGAGGLIENNSVSLQSTVEITVGAGGAGGGASTWWTSGSNGQNSTIGSSLVAVGGGGGGGRASAGQVGGSGGGAGGRGLVAIGAAGTALQGNSGGGITETFANGASGGGAGGSGGSSSQTVRGSAGVGKSSSIAGSAVTYAVGGVGGSRTGTSALTNSAGTYGTGGAGSNGGYTQAQGGWGRGETGANGVVIIRLPASNTVTYDSKGGTSVSNGSFITGGSIASAPTAPTRSGYTFDGWSDTDGGSAITFPYSPGVASNITLYAKWTGNSNTVTYDSKGGTSIANGSFLSGGSISSAPSPAPTRAGYTLAGWSATDGGSVVTFPYSPGAITGITLYAKWTANTNTVTYDSKGGTAVTSGSFTTGGLIANAPTDPTRTGYIFAGWSATDVGTAITFPYSPTATSAITLYARWTEITYVITYDRNSATGSPERATDTYTYTGGAVTLATVGTMTKTGYRFDGWQVSGTTTKLSSTYTPSADVTLEARWAAASYTITYFSNSGGTAPSAETYTTGGSAVTLPTQGSMSRTGYTFNGWSTTINDVSTKIANSQSSATLTTSVPMNLFALWTAVNYSVTYCEESTCSNPAAFSGSVPVDATVYNIGNSVIVKANSGNLLRTGYSFAGWTTDSDGGGTALMSGQTLTVQSANIRFYPQWSANTYTITYNANGATGDLARTTETYTTAGSTITLPNVGSMSKTGYTFAGWSTSSTGSVLSGAFTTSSNVTLFAIWTIKSIPYKLLMGSANSNPLSGSNIAVFPLTDTITSTYGANVVLPSVGTGDEDIAASATYGGASYKFLGWKYGSRTYAPGATFAIPDLVAPATHLEFTAQWIRILEVRYVLNGGTGIVDVDADDCDSSTYLCLDGDVIGLSAAPSRSGYSFTGWTATSDGSGTLYQPSDSFTVNTNAFVFYAKWTAIPYIMTFNSNGGNATVADQVKNIGQSFTFPSPGTRAGYDFNGWIRSDIMNSPTYGVGTTYVTGSSSIPFVASWTPHTYTVTYNWNGGVGSPTAPADYTVGQTAITLPTGTNTRDGYIFDGWQAAGTTTKLTSPYAPTANTLLEARWLDGAYIITFNNFNGLANTTSSVTRATALTLPTPTRAGFSFAGWYQDSAYTLLYGQGGASVTPTATGTLYAKWTQNSLVGINPAHLNSLVELTMVSNSASNWTGSHTLSGTAAELSIPANALPAGTKVNVSFVEDLSRPASLIDGNNAYFTSVAVHWLSGTGASATVPDAASGSPLSLKLTNPAIVAGAKVFKIVNGVVTEVATATVDGEVAITFTQDPEFVVAATRPGSPTAVTATNNQNAQSTISWNAPLGNGGSSVTGYTVTASPGGATCTTAGTSCQITGLTNNTSYTFTVKATNAIGDSLPSSPSSAITPRLAINYNVIFNSNGGSPVANSSFVENGSLNAPTDPTRSGYNFIGWATTDGNESTIISFPYSPSNADLTLYAIWRASNPALNPNNSGSNGAVITPVSTKSTKATPKASVSSKPSAQATSSAKPTNSQSPAATPEPTPTPKDLFANAPKPNAGIDTPNKGNANAIVGDESVETVVTVTEFAKQIEIGDSISISFQATDAAGNQLPTSPDGSVQVLQGATISASGNGFKPDSPVEAWLYSTPVLLGAGLANSDGSFDNTYAINADVPLGDHTVVLHGISPTDEVITLALGVTVIADDEATDSSSNTLLLAILAFLGALLTVGLWLVLRRQSGTHKK